MEQLTLRLPKDLALELRRKARKLGRKRSELVRQALRLYLADGLAEERPAEVRPYERVRGLIGVYQSGVPDLGLRHRDHLIRRLRGGR